MPQTRGAWVALAVFVCVVLTIFTWFFFVSPKLDERSDLVGQEQALVGENNRLEAKVAVLRAQFARIDEYRGELSQLQVRIPTIAQTDDLLDSIDALASKHDVIVNEIVSDGGKSLMADPVAEPTPKPTEKDTEKEKGKDKGDAKKDGAAKKQEPKPAPAWMPDGPTDLVTLPYQISIAADYADAVKFIEALQTSKDRFFLVSDPVVTALDQEQDDVTKELTVAFTLYAFVLTEEQAPAPAGDEESTPKKIRKSKENRFVTTT